MTGKKISIRMYFLIIAVTVLIIPMLLVTFFGMNKIRDDAFLQKEKDIVHQLGITVENINNIFSSAITKLTSDLTLAQYILNVGGRPFIDESSSFSMDILNQETKKSGKIQIHEMKTGRGSLFYNYDIVDEIKELTGTTATVFQVIPGGLLRISTNVLKKDNKRAVGTYIPETSEVYKTVMSGSTYYGRAFVVNAYYLTVYKPFHDDSGNIIGVIYVGVKEDLYKNKIHDELKTIRIGKSGRYFIIEKNGKALLGFPDMSDEFLSSAAQKDSDSNLYSFYAMNGEKQLLTAIAVFNKWNWKIGLAFDTDEVSELHRESTKVMYIMISIVFIICLLLIMFLSGYITKPVGVVKDKMNSVSGGDLTVDFNNRSFIKEIDSLNKNISFVLLENFQKLIFGVKSRIQTVVNGSEIIENNLNESEKANNDIRIKASEVTRKSLELDDQVHSSYAAISQIRDSVNRLSERVADQSSSVEETSASIIQMSASIDSVARIAEKRKSGADKLAESSKEGGERITETNNIISDISTHVNSMLDVISVINNITSQTELLSMNAAIEAAHAGEYGKGFSVVADEIRKLAENTSDNAKHITSSLKLVVDRIQAARDASDVSSQVFSEIVSYIDVFINSFTEITNSTAEVSAGSSEILEAVKLLRDVSLEIKSSTGEILKGTIDIDDSLSIIKNNSNENLSASRSVEKTASDMEELVAENYYISRWNRSNSEKLRKAVEEFKISENRFNSGIDISDVILSHKRWITELEKIINGKSSIENLITDSRMCFFGKWLNSTGKEKYSGFEKYSEIVEKHDELHSIGKVILSNNKDNWKQAYYEESENLKTKSRYLIRLLLEFANDTGNDEGYID